MEHSEQLNDLAKSLVAAQGEFPSIRKTEEGKIKGTTKTGSSYEYSYSYADLASVVETVQPILVKHGLAVSQFVTHEGDQSLLQTYLLHESGQFITHAMPLLLAKQDAQGQGSAITYARRYSYMAVLGLVADEDDDGRAASHQAAQKPASAPHKPAAVPAPEPVNKTDFGKPGLIRPDSMAALKAVMHRKDMTGTKAVEFAEFIIGKPKPESEQEVQSLLAALEAGE
jgi:hypothetical protein